MGSRKTIGKIYIFGENGRNRASSTVCGNPRCEGIILRGQEAVYVGNRSRGSWRHPSCYVDANGKPMCKVPAIAQPQPIISVAVIVEPPKPFTRNARSVNLLTGGDIC